ncbi:hypothetical protein Pcinc_014637 [Petrolisthes cinctipes]|uniref:Uncharacterized protein n=1 Tax=Petrolisthes cinctipes TaxID=88211 RepID=A0AAE1KR76_PETCI|nr:hypothetical protein Pcinc_014637 [Petrolisthes cinctipes]
MVQLCLPVVHSTLLLLVVVVWAGCVEGQQGSLRSRCAGFDCDSRCNLEPQRCDDCCPADAGGSGHTEKSDSERLEELEREVRVVKVLVGVLMGLVVVMVILVGTGVFLYLSRHCHGSTFTLPLFLRGKAERQKAKEASKMETATRVQPDPTAVRIAHYQNKHSPLGRRASSSRRPTATSNTPPSSFDDHHPHPHHLPPHFPKQRTRQPSESSSPDDPSNNANTSTTPDHPHAYHNLALSTSTLHDTSSTSTLAPALSTITLDTTLASGAMHIDDNNVQSSPPQTSRI